jgi:hypothetical protein
VTGCGFVADLSSPLLFDDEKHQLATITQHPAWPVLRRRWDELKSKKALVIGRSVMAGDEIDQRKVDYERGYWDGVNAVLATPGSAEQALLREHRDKGVDVVDDSG